MADCKQNIELERDDNETDRKHGCVSAYEDMVAHREKCRHSDKQIKYDFFLFTVSFSFLCRFFPIFEHNEK